MKTKLFVLVLVTMMMFTTTKAYAVGNIGTEWQLLLTKGEFLQGVFDAQMNLLSGLSEGSNDDPHYPYPIGVLGGGVGFQIFQGFSLIGEGQIGGGNFGGGKAVWGVQTYLPYADLLDRKLHLEVRGNWWAGDGYPTNRYSVVPRAEFWFAVQGSHQLGVVGLATYFRSDADPGVVFRDRNKSGDSNLKEENGVAYDSEDPVGYSSAGWGNEYLMGGGGGGYRYIFPSGKGDISVTGTAQFGQMSGDGKMLGYNASPPDGYQVGDDPKQYPDRLITGIYGAQIRLRVF